MNIADYLILALIVICAVVGLMRGFLRELIALITWIVGMLAAWHLAWLLEPQLGGALAGAAVRPWAARATVLVGVLLLGAAVGAVIVNFVRLAIFGGVDRLLGFVVGMLRGVLLLGIIVLFCQALGLDQERWWQHSMLVPYGEKVAAGLRGMVGEPAHRRTADLSVFNYVGGR